MTSPAELLQSELRAKLDGQLATLESARTRAGIAVSASGVVAGLFAQHLKSPIGNWGLAALSAFLVGSLPAVWILIPHRMTLSPKGHEWLEFVTKHDAFVRGQLTTPEPDRAAVGDLGAAQLAVAMSDSMLFWYKKNAPLLNLVHLCVAVAFASVLVQIVCWAGAVDDGLKNIWYIVGPIGLAVILSLILAEYRLRSKQNDPEEARSPVDIQTDVVDAVRESEPPPG